MNELHYQLDLLKAMNQNLTEKLRMHEKIAEIAEGAFLYYSFEKKRLSSFGSWKEFFDFDMKDTRDLMRLTETVEENQSLALRDVLFLEKAFETERMIECRLKEKKTWMIFIAKVTYDANGLPTDKVIRVVNNTKARIQNDELVYMAYYDSLTGLYNRNNFVRLLSEQVRIAKETNNIVSVMIIDIDEFRKVNDGLGIVVGDELVQQVGAFLKELCDDNIIACHLHSDVFCMAILDPTGDRSVDSIYQKIRKRIKSPFYISSGQEITITVSVGVAEYPQASTSVLELINCAEIVVFKCKKHGRNMIQYFDAPILDDFLNTIELENKLKRAILNQDFFMSYQPQYYSGNRRLRGVEALIRWRDEDSNLISPAVFIPIAEKNGSIIPIGKWVIEESVKQYSIWRKQFGFPFIMSINISSLQYKRDDFVVTVMDVLNKYRVCPSEIELEITEGVLIDDFNIVTDKLRLLREYGIRISLDDFGTGFSSLSYLKQLPIDTLKLDKSFIDTVLSDHATRVITESIINMVKSLEIESVAEGVEYEKQYEYLHSIGCDVIQGYLFGKPLIPEEFEKVLSEV